RALDLHHLVGGAAGGPYPGGLQLAPRGRVALRGSCLTRSSVTGESASQVALTPALTLASATPGATYPRQASRGSPRLTWLIWATWLIWCTIDPQINRKARIKI